MIVAKKFECIFIEHVIKKYVKIILYDNKFLIIIISSTLRFSVKIFIVKQYSIDGRLPKLRLINE
jgi:hypothetical protein